MKLPACLLLSLLLGACGLKGGLYLPPDAEAVPEADAAESPPPEGDSAEDEEAQP